MADCKRRSIGRDWLDDGPGQDPFEQRSVRDRSSDRAGVVHRPGERDDPVERDLAERALEADDPAVRGRPQDRTNRLGADRPGHLPGGNRSRRAR